MKKTNKNPISFTEQVYAVVSRIPRGQTMTYLAVAQAAGSPRAYRAVGNILRRNPDPKLVPCHRVVRSDGQGGGYFGEKNSNKKLKLLKQEGVFI